MFFFSYLTSNLVQIADPVCVIMTRAIHTSYILGFLLPLSLPLSLSLTAAFYRKIPRKLCVRVFSLLFFKASIPNVLAMELYRGYVRHTL